MHFLILQDPATGKRRRVPLTGSRATLGAGDGNTIVLRREGIATHHFTLERLRDGFKIVDEHTERGTLVNGAYVGQKRLEPGDRIEVGGCELVYEERPDPAPAAAPAGVDAVPPAARAPVAAPAAATVAPETPRERPPAPTAAARIAGRAALLLRTLLYTATALVLVAAVVTIVPRFLDREKTRMQALEDRREVVRVWLDSGRLDEAAKVLDALERLHPELPLDAERQRLATGRLRRERAAADLLDLEGDTATPTAQRLERARSLLASYDDLPEAGPALEDRVRLLERRLADEEIAARPTLAQLHDMSDAFLEQQNYTGALGVWTAAGTTDLLTDVEVQEAARETIDSAAEVESERILARVEERLQHNDYLGASIVLDESEIRPFRGTPVYQQMEHVAARIEEVLEQQVPRGGLVTIEPRRPAEPEPRPGHPAPRPGVTRAPDDGSRVAPIEQAIAEGDGRFSAADLPGALAAYAAALAADLPAAERERLTRRIERANRAQWFVDTVVARVEGEPDAARTVEVTTRDGATTGPIVGVEDGTFLIAAGGGSVSVAPLALAPRSMHALARVYRLAPEDLLNQAFYAMIDRDLERIDPLLLKALDVPSLKASVDSAVTFARGLPEVPEWGYFRHENQWMTFRERERAQNAKLIDAAVAKLDQADEAKHAAALEELSALLPVAREPVLAVLKERRARMLKELQSQAEIKALDAVFEHKRELDRRRAKALELIFDEERYFYPYTGDKVPPDKAGTYHKVQQEVDELVGRVRDVWGKEFDEVQGGVALSNKFERLLARLRTEQDVLIAAEPTLPRNEPVLQVLDLLPASGGKVTVRNIALDAAERARLDQDELVLAYNVQNPGIAQKQELEQLWVTNMYRRMMGRRALKTHDALVRAARGHSEWLSRTGKFQHENDEDPKLHSPLDRIHAQGYLVNGAGENLAKAGGAMGAHDGWTHSSGHHRNMLFESHAELGVGNLGNLWTQNYAGASSYTGNMADAGTWGN